MIKERQNKAGGDLAGGKEAGNELDWPTGAWRLVKGRILRAPNWAGQGPGSLRERGVSLKIWVWRGGRWRGVGVNGEGGFPSHMKVCGDECAIIRLISSLIYRSRGYQRLHIRGRPED